MGKKSFGRRSVLIWIISISVIIFNNGFQLFNSIMINQDLLIAFLSIVSVVSYYGIKNKKEIFKK